MQCGSYHFIVWLLTILRTALQKESLSVAANPAFFQISIGSVVGLCCGGLAIDDELGCDERNLVEVIVEEVDVFPCKRRADWANPIVIGQGKPEVSLDELLGELDPCLVKERV